MLDDSADALDDDEPEELELDEDDSDIEEDEDDIDAGLTDGHGHDGVVETVSEWELVHDGVELEADDSAYATPVAGDLIGMYFYSNGWVMGKVTKVAKNQRTVKRFTVVCTDNEISIWALSKEEWESGLWRKISSECSWSPSQ